MLPYNHLYLKHYVFRNHNSHSHSHLHKHNSNHNSHSFNVVLPDKL